MQRQNRIRQCSVRSFAWAALILSTAASVTAANSITFRDYRHDYLLPINQSGVGVAAGDLNKDGIDDVFTITASGVVVLLSENGSTNYAKPVVYPAGNEPVSIAVGDFNRDGYVDVVTANDAGDDLTILFGAANGKLGAPVHIGAGPGPVAVVTADFNLDGKLDLAVADLNDNEVAILNGNGDGTFQTPVTFTVGSQPASLCLGDFNNDGRIDIAVASQTGSVTVLLGNGAGRFTASSASASGAALTYSITAADFNGDGKLDIAVAEFAASATGHVYVSLGKGDGTFQEPTTVSLPQYAPAVTSGDINGDGHPDLIAVLSNQTSTAINALAILLNKGTGTFTAPQLDGSPETPATVAAVDLNHDGKLDVIVASIPDIYSGQSFVSVVFGRGTTSLSEVAEIASSGASAVATGDVNGDGDLDLVVASISKITVYLGNAKGSFTAQAPETVPGGLEIVAVADVNGDGKLDIIGAGGAGGEVKVLLGKGDGTFSEPKSYPGLFSVGFAVGDINGDGYADVVLSGALTSGVQVLWGSSTGALITGPFLTTLYDAQATQAVAIGDFNGDGQPDIAVSSYDGSNLQSYIELFPGHGKNTFGPEVKTAVPVNGSIVTGDMNNDGLPDLVLSGIDLLNIQTSTGVLLSNGDGTFRAGAFQTTPYWPGAIAVADFNGDGNLDTVVLPLSQQLVTLAGDGAGHLAFQTIYGAGAGAWTNLVSGDFLNDRKPGLAFANVIAGTFSVVENVSK